MPSTPTLRNRLLKQGPGENSNTWGGLLNAQVIDTVDESLDGYVSVPVTGNLTLTSVNFTTDQARNRFLEFTGTVAATITIPAVSKLYFVRNASTQTLTFTTGGATNASIAAGKAHWIVCTGSAVYKDTTADDAAGSATAAATSASNAAGSATAAGTSATNSANSATASANSATSSANSATLSQNWAISTTTVDGVYFGARKYAIDAGNSSILASEWAIKTNGTVDGTNFSAKYWAGQAAASSGVPNPTGQAGKSLTNDGTTTAWGTMAVVGGGTGATTPAGARTNLGLDAANIQFVMDGGGSVIATGIKGDIEVPFACTINGWDLLADQAGSITVDVWRDTYANFPPTSVDVIVSPAIASATKATAANLAIAVGAGDILRFNLASIATITRATLVLKVTR